MQKTKIPDSVEPFQSLLLLSIENNAILNVMCDMITNIRMKDMSQEEKDNYIKKTNDLLMEYREKAKTFLVAAK